MKRTLLLLLAACSSPTTPDPMVPEGITHRTNLAATHVSSCTDASQCGRDEPPAGGPHCASPLACRVFTMPQGRCNYVHNLEHGHIVLAYNCPSGCADLVADLEGFYASQASPKRVLLTPDPMLQTKVAAMVWGYTWAGDTVDLAKLAEIQKLQDKDAPEAGLGCAQ